MRAHRTRIVVTESREISAKLPAEFPCGSAELIVISDLEVDAMTPERRAQEFHEWLEALLRRVPPGPALATWSIALRSTMTERVRSHD